MAAYDFLKMKKKLKKYLDEERYEHTMGVMYTSGALAMAHGCSVEDALAAGLLHDCAKCVPNKKKLKMCDQHKIPMSEFEKKNPFLLHGKLGAYLAEKKYEVKDPDVLNAIRYHTTGRAGMSTLEKIVYIADYIEPMRTKAPRLPQVRQLAFQNLDECMFEILKDTLEYLEGQPGKMDETTAEAFRFYKNLHLTR